MKTKFECSDCARKFETATEFTDHFKREGQNIVGCHKKSLKTNIN